VVDEVTQ
jgi:hypothetical protein